MEAGLPPRRIVPTPAELRDIERQYSAYLKTQADNDRIQQEELQRRQIEQARLSAIRQLELEKETAARQREAERQAAIAQIAHSELQKRQQTALRRIAVTPTNIECNLSFNCAFYKLTIGIRNQSGESISAVSLGWVFVPRDGTLNCPTSIATIRQLQVKLMPNDTTVFNIDGHDGPTSTQFRYCVRVTGVEF
jgi:hypothetical protein